MSVDKYTVFTDYAWLDDERPDLRMGNKDANLYIGGRHVALLKGASASHLQGQLEGYAEMFSEAAKSLQNQDEQ